MVAEVLEHLAPARGGVFVDCTVGPRRARAGDARGRGVAVIGLDRDPAALARRARRSRAFGDRVELVHSDYRDLDEVLDARAIGAVDGVLADLGVSSMQLDAPGRGFSFRRDEPLDMRMDTIAAARRRPRRWRAADEQTLADVIYEFGEERHARRVARAIVAARDAGADRRRRGSSPTSCGGRFRARGTRGSIRRRGRSRRSASG